jgi:hypothetical protein
MSNDQDESPIKPQVIDLDAEDVVADDRDGAPPPPDVKPKRETALLWWTGGALLLGLLVGGWLYRDVLSSYFPSSGLNNATARIATLEQQTRAIADQSASAADQAAVEAKKLGQQAAMAGQAAREAQAQSAAMDQRLTGVEAKLTSLANDVKALQERPTASAGQASDAPAASDLALLAKRVDALEEELASLKVSAGPVGPSAGTAGLAQALADLKGKIAAGLAYQPDLERIQKLVPAAAGLDVLASHAQENLPNAEGLAREITEIAPGLPKPVDEAQPGTGYFDRFWDALSGIITIRQLGEANWPELAGRIADAARTGNLAQAIALIDQTEGEKPAAIAQWRGRAEARLAVEAALAEASQSVAKQLASQGVAP